MDAIVAVNTAPWASVNTDKQLAELHARLASDPEWHGGRYYGKGGAKTALTDIRVETLKRYGIEANLTPRFPDPAAREAAIREQRRRTGRRNGTRNSLIILRRALLGFDTRPDFARIKAKLLYMLCRTDNLFPPKIAPGVMRGARRGRGRGALFRARQRSRPQLGRPRARQMVAGAARVPGAAGRPAELGRLAGAVSPQPVERCKRARAKTLPLRP